MGRFPCSTRAKVCQTVPTLAPKPAPKLCQSCAKRERKSVPNWRRVWHNFWHTLWCNPGSTLAGHAPAHGPQRVHISLSIPSKMPHVPPDAGRKLGTILAQILAHFGGTTGPYDRAENPANHLAHIFGTKSKLCQNCATEVFNDTGHLQRPRLIMEVSCWTQLRIQACMQLHSA